MGQDYEALAKNQPLYKHTLASHTITQHAPEWAPRSAALATRKMTKARQTLREVSTDLGGMINLACFEKAILKTKSSYSLTHAQSELKSKAIQANS